MRSSSSSILILSSDSNLTSSVECISKLTTQKSCATLDGESVPTSPASAPYTQKHEGTFTPTTGFELASPVFERLRVCLHWNQQT